MGPFVTLRRIILPQALRAIAPQIGNGTIAMLKGTSLASVVFVNELTFRAQQIVATNFDFFTVFIAAGALYLCATTLISLGQLTVERRLDPELRSVGRTPSLWSRWLTGVLTPAADAPVEPVEPDAGEMPRSGGSTSGEGKAGDHMIIKALASSIAEKASGGGATPFVV
jgi:polar amino acid transport system permease protein